MIELSPGLTLEWNKRVVGSIEAEDGGPDVIDFGHWRGVAVVVFDGLVAEHVHGEVLVKLLHRAALEATKREKQSKYLQSTINRFTRVL